MEIDGTHAARDGLAWVNRPVTEAGFATTCSERAEKRHAEIRIPDSHKRYSCSLQLSKCRRSDFDISYAFIARMEARDQEAAQTNTVNRPVPSSRPTSP